MNCLRGGSSASSRSIVCSSRSMSESETAAFVMRPAIRDDGIREPRTEGEQVLLDRLDRARQIRVRRDGARDSQAGIELVDLPVGVDASVRLGDPRIVEQGRLACVAGLCVDLHRVEL